MTTTPDGQVSAHTATIVAPSPGLSVRDNIASRVADDPAWLLVLRQYDHGVLGYPDPFANRRPVSPATPK